MKKITGFVACSNRDKRFEDQGITIVMRKIQRYKCYVCP